MKAYASFCFVTVVLLFGHAVLAQQTSGLVDSLSERERIWLEKNGLTTEMLQNLNESDTVFLRTALEKQTLFRAKLSKVLVFGGVGAGAIVGGFLVANAKFSLLYIGVGIMLAGMVILPVSTLVGLFVLRHHIQANKLIKQIVQPHSLE